MASRFEKFSERARRVLSLAQEEAQRFNHNYICLLYTSPSPRDKRQSRMPSSA